MSPAFKIATLTADKIFRAFYGFVAFIFITNYLNPTEVGIFSLVMSMIAISNGFIGLGISSIVVVEGAKNYSENSTIIQQDFYIRFLSALVVLALSILIVHFFYNKSDIFLYYLLISLYLLCQVSMTIENDLKAKGEPHKIALIKIVPSTVAFFAKIILLMKFNSLALLLVVILIEAFINLVLLILFSTFSISKTIKKLSFKFMNESYKLVKRSLPFLFSFIAMLLYTRIDQFFISEMVGLEQLAIYAVGIKVQDSALGLIFILNIYFIRHLSESYGTSNFPSMFRGISSLAVSLALIGLILWILFGDEILNIFFSDVYQDSYLITAILMTGLLIQSAAVVRTNFYVLNNVQKIIYLSSFLGLVCNILLNYLLIPHYGIEGAALASLISQIVSLLLVNIIYSETIDVLKWMTYSLFLPFNKYNFSLIKKIYRKEIL